MSVPHLISPLAIAPMIDWTYTHFRVFMRMLAPHALLYTDMQTIGAIFNNPSRALQFHPMEDPLALQLGGNHPEHLAECARLAEDKGFVEVNLNLGCPSDKVQSGHFGACLMKEPKRVAESIRAMKSAVHIPVTAKVRIGIDEEDSFDFFKSFVDALMDAGCDKLIVHARKAWLRGLNPKQNRTIPPVHYDYVYRMKQILQNTAVVINGNIERQEDVHMHLEHVDGVMLGRLACQNPYAIAEIHHSLYQENPLRTRAAILQEYFHYANEQHQLGVSLSLLLKPILSFAHALPGARGWREQVAQVQRLNDASGFSLILERFEKMSNVILRAAT